MIMLDETPGFLSHCCQFVRLDFYGIYIPYSITAINKSSMLCILTNSSSQLISIHHLIQFYTLPNITYLPLTPTIRFPGLSGAPLSVLHPGNGLHPFRLTPPWHIETSREAHAAVALFTRLSQAAVQFTISEYNEIVQYLMLTGIGSWD